MGVNNEKEPLSGTTPERWLFDRSLHLGNEHENIEFFQSDNASTRTLMTEID